VERGLSVGLRGHGAGEKVPSHRRTLAQFGWHWSSSHVERPEWPRGLVIHPPDPDSTRQIRPGAARVALCEAVGCLKVGVKEGKVVSIRAALESLNPFAVGDGLETDAFSADAEKETPQPSLVAGS
jgi:hypothetical protein